MRNKPAAGCRWPFPRLLLGAGLLTPPKRPTAGQGTCGVGRPAHNLAKYYGRMPSPRWSLASLLSVVLFAALAAGGFRLFYTDQHPNAWLWLGLFLATLTTASLGAWRGWPRLRRPCLGYAAY